MADKRRLSRSRAVIGADTARCAAAPASSPAMCGVTRHSFSSRSQASRPKFGRLAFFRARLERRLNALPPALQSRDMRDLRLEKLADVLVNYSVGVKPNQLVRISGPPIAQPL